MYSTSESVAINGLYAKTGAWVDAEMVHFNKNYFRLIWHLTIQSKNAISCLICVSKFPREMMYFYGFFMISKLYLCFVQRQIVCSVSAEVVREGMIWGQ